MTDDTQKRIAEIEHRHAKRLSGIYDSADALLLNHDVTWLLVQLDKANADDDMCEKYHGDELKNLRAQRDEANELRDRFAEAKALAETKQTKLGYEYHALVESFYNDRKNDERVLELTTKLAERDAEITRLKDFGHVRTGGQEWFARPQNDGTTRVVGRIVLNGHPIYSIEAAADCHTAESERQMLERLQRELYEKAGRFLITGSDR